MPDITTENIGFYIIIAVPIFFILRRLLKKFIQNSLYRTITTTLLTLVLTPVIYSGAVVIFFSILFNEPSRKFDTGSWKTNTRKRFQMSDNIIKNKLFLGKDTTQIKELLGNTKQKYQDSTKQINWIYEMGEGGGGLGFLFHILSITFKNNKAIQVQHFEIRD